MSIIFDTDMGNDVDDALALGMIHALESRGKCKLLAVTITKDHVQAAPFVDCINTFYGRGDIPIGVVHGGATRAAGKYNLLADKRDNGVLRYPHDLASGNDAPDAVSVLREVLAAQPDRSVVIVQVGFSTNLMHLLRSSPDRRSPLSGPALAKQKVRFLSMMAGAFQPINGKRHLEYNITEDIPSARTMVAQWPTPIVFSGYEVGLAITYPAVSIEQDFGYDAHHPLAEAYRLYMPPPHNRPCWDLTSVLAAIEPERGYFGISEPGRVTVEADGFTRFTPSGDGPHRYLTVAPEQVIRAREAFVQLASEPPCAGGK